MEHKFIINDFEGPLDLLLHLIKKADMNIMDINVCEITKQYLDFISEMESINLSIASEYLVMASMLIEMKSRELLNEKEELSEDDDSILSKEELTKQLIDYSNYKEASLRFRELENGRKDFFTKIPTDIKVYSDFTAIKNNGDIVVDHLVEAFAKFMERRELDKPLKTKTLLNELSLEDSVKNIRTILNRGTKVKFEELFTSNHKSYIIITFLSILEMAREQEIVIKQDDNFDIIYIELRGV